MNANQAQSKGQAANGPQGQTKQQNAKMNAKIMEAVNTKFLGKSRTFYFWLSFNILDNEPHDWPTLYKLKLKFCY